MLTAIGATAVAGAFADVSSAAAAAPTKLPERVDLRLPDGGVRTIAFEEYLKGVVAIEMRSSWPAEALKAQAVAARTFALMYLAQRGFLAAGVGQAWDESRRTAHSDAAVDATRGQLVVRSGAPIWTYYSSTCGGQTAAGSGGSASYCQPVRCWSEGEPSFDLQREPDAAAFWDVPTAPRSFCAESPHFRHGWTLEPSALAAVLDRFLPARAAPRYRVGELLELRDLAVVSRAASGRAERLRVTGPTGVWEVKGDYPIRTTLRDSASAGPLRSSGFVVLWERGGDGSPRVRVRGGGAGHGIGMCQYGAKGQADRGRDYQAILRHYYRGVEIVTA